MASVHSIEVDANKVMEQVTIKVHVSGLRKLRARLWVATRLLKVAAFVAGCGIEVLGLKEDGENGERT